MTIGRPKIEYNPEIGSEICRLIATSTKGIRGICKDHADWPSADTVYGWIYEHKEFGDMYARAKAAQQDVMVEYVLERSEDSSKDQYIDADGSVKSNMASINRDRLIADNMKWAAARLSIRYKDKQDINSNITVQHESGIKDLA